MHHRSLSDGIIAVVPSLTRRALLRGVAVSAIAVPLGTAALTSCSTEPSAEEVLAGRLVPLAIAATASADDARRLGAAEPGRVAALNEIAIIRDEHARLLRDEITRLHPASVALITTPSASPAVGSATPGSATPGTSTPARPQPAGLAEFRAGLTTDAVAARQVATTASGFQAGLTASICASIASLPGVLA